MIFVSRHLAPQRAWFARAVAAREQAGRFFSTRLSRRAQQRFAFDKGVYAAPAIKALLPKQFLDKCAYCESPVSGIGFAHVDHFRPKGRAMSLNGKSRPDHYWWLAYEWENLYLACQVCSSAKGQRFPIQGPWAKPLTFGTDLAREKPYLLDPCADRPDEHLVFTEEGLVVSTTERGRVTIDVLNLNRDELVDRRRRAVGELAAQLEGVVRARGWDLPNVLVDLNQLLADSSSYAAARRQIYPRLVHRLAGRTPGAVALLNRVSPTPVVLTPTDLQQTLDRYIERKQRVENYSVEDDARREDFAGQARYVEEIGIRNFAALGALDLEFPPAAADGQPWLMLLGENATGKSSVLKAVALTLLGMDRANDLIARLGIPAYQLLHWGEDEHEGRGRRRADDEHEGRVTIRTAAGHVLPEGGAGPFTLRIQAGADRFVAGPAEPKVPVLGYGSTRLPARPGHRPPDSTSVVRVTNLFDPFAPLLDPTEWLCGLPTDQFDKVAVALKTLLVLDERAVIRPVGRGDRRIEVEVAGTRVPLEGLSTGYQSVVALACDMMMVLSRRFDEIEDAEGLVLLDEIDAHLHPRWKMQIVGRLRRVFRRLRFIATTHDPLCLRGLRTEEIVVLRRVPAKPAATAEVYRLTDLPAVESLRADQLLTSEYFGLSSTIDPELEKEFDEYYELLALRQPSKGDRTRIRELKGKLDRLEVLGSTRRERLLLEATDQFLAAERAIADTEERKQLKAGTRQKLRTLWDKYLGGKEES